MVMGEWLNPIADKDVFNLIRFGIGGEAVKTNGSALISKTSLRTFAALCVLCGKETFKTINRKERPERKVHAKT